MNAPLYLYRVSFACEVSIIIAAVNIQAALDCAKAELVKYHKSRSNDGYAKDIAKSPCTGIKQINIGTHFAVAPEPTPSDTQGGAA